VTTSSSVPAIQGWGAAEVLFHEASHVLAFSLMDDFTAELRTQRKASPHLWHAALFYLTGEVVRETLAERGMTYEPYLYRTSLFDRMWPDLKGPIETHWKPYVDGQVERDAAVRSVVRAVKGSGMSVAAFFTDIVFRWRAAEVAALFVLALWASLSIGPVLNLRALLVIAVTTAFLALTVRTLTYPAGNVVLHALATGFTLIAARGLVGLTQHAFDEVGVNELTPHLGFFLTEENAVRKQNGATTGLGLEAALDVLPEGVIRPTLGRRPVQVAPPRVRGERVPVPLLDGIGWIGQYHVELHQTVALHKLRVR
jgi:hypothetical protein